ncbi:MAG: hypothetical protein ABSC06_04730 [Rhodopila sp.]
MRFWSIAGSARPEAAADARCRYHKIASLTSHLARGAVSQAGGQSDMVSVASSPPPVVAPLTGAGVFVLSGVVTQSEGT